MNFLQKAKQIYELQAQAKRIKKELANIHVEGEETIVVKNSNQTAQATDSAQTQESANSLQPEQTQNSQVVVTINGSLEFVSVKIPPQALQPENAPQLEEAVCKAAQRALKEAQKIAQEKMKGVMGDMQGLIGGQS